MRTVHVGRVGAGVNRGVNRGVDKGVSRVNETTSSAVCAQDARQMAIARRVAERRNKAAVPVLDGGPVT